MPASTATPAIDFLRRLTGRPDADFRDGQLEAIEQIVDRRGRVLCVQRTGWGKSAVYFVATAMLREQGAGPTILVSPLIALMRNQLDAAAALGIEAATVNSSNRETGPRPSSGSTAARSTSSCSAPSASPTSSSAPSSCRTSSRRAACS